MEQSFVPVPAGNHDAGGGADIFSLRAPARQDSARNAP